MELNQAAARARTMFVCTTETLAAMRRGPTGGGLGAQAQWRGSMATGCCGEGIGEAVQSARDGAVEEQDWRRGG